MTGIVFDSSTIISITQTCMSKILLEDLVEETKMKFFISQSVFEESVSNPMKIKRFELTASRINDLVERNYLEVYPSSEKLVKEAQRVMDLANSIFSMKNHSLAIVQKGEAECLAILNLTEQRILSIDERTTRMLIEEPKALQNYVEFKFKSKLQVNQGNLNKFGIFIPDIVIVRSSELLALAVEKGLFSNKKNFVEGALYALKFSGCSVSDEEVDDFLQKVA